MFPIILFVFVLIICASALFMIVFDALESDKMFKLEQQKDLHDQILKMENGKIKEQFENENKNKKKKQTKNIDITKYILKSKLKPDEKCPETNKLLEKTKIPDCKTCPDMDDYIKKTEVPSCPPPTDMSNYIHKNDIPKQESKPVWHHLTGIADMFKDYFMKHSPKPIKVEHSPKPEPEPQPKPEPTPEPNPEPEFYGNDKNHMSLFASNDILRPANSFTCNGYAPKRTDTCYYY